MVLSADLIRMVFFAALTFSCAPKRGQAMVDAAPTSRSESRRQPNFVGGTPLDSRERVHLLSRFTFGPTARSLQQLEEVGAMRWFETQLSLTAYSNATLEQALVPYIAAMGPPDQVVQAFQREVLEHGELGDDLPDFERLVRNANANRTLMTLQMTELTRHMLSPAQLHEVMVDFWTNHFNVYVRKSHVLYLASDYLERAIRPHALGNFANLLAATARHPAMLLYLDNAESRRPAVRGTQGLNENYARELLELHTLGVDAGYTQNDVLAAAHILTGWSVQTTREGPWGFVFREGWHSPEPRTVLHETFSAPGVKQGEQLLAWLASHPATARHLATKLCARFVADDPPYECIDVASKAFLNSGGEIASVLRAIVGSEFFWRPELFGQMTKSPLDFAISAARAVGARPNGSLTFAHQLTALGEPIFMNPTPTGYSTRAETWTSTEGMMQRYRFATSLATGRAGLTVPADTILPDVSTADALRRSIAQGWPLSSKPHEMAEIVEPLSQIDDQRDRKILVLSMLVGSAEFQRK